MPRRVFQAATYTPTATADGVALTNATYQAMEAASATQMLSVQEIEIGGQAPSTSSPCIMQFARNLTAATTPTALAAPNGDGPLNGAVAALAAPPVTYVAAATGPQRTNTALTARLNLSLNAYGGIVRWQAMPGGEWVIIGTAVSVAPSSLSAFTGGTPGLIGSHIIYEV
jgi:hypothetical protein